MINSTDECTTCKACIQICPTKCIKVDSFDKIYVDSSLCVNCGACNKVCQITNTPNFNIPYTVFAAYNKDNHELMRSSSGGVGSILLRKCLSKGYKIFSALYDSNVLPVIHEVLSSNINEVLRSKYCFSDINDSYIKCKDYLKRGEKVLFIALPCQIGGLKLFLNKNYSNLYCVDLFCHGAPSSIELRKHLSYKGLIKGSKVINVEFRDKRFSKWGNYCIGYFYSDGTISSKPALCDYYFSNFVRGTFFRECCYRCKYAKFERVGDISIGDYWHYIPKNIDPSSNGISAVLINNKNGKELWELIQNDCEYEEGTRQSVELATHAVLYPMKRPKNYMTHAHLTQLDYNRIAKSQENSIIQILRLLKFKVGF